MRGFLRRFRRSQGTGVPCACYLRENGPIAYALEIFGHAPRDRAGVLVATDLAWYWRTIARDGAAREWTQLTSWSLAALLGDLATAHRGAEGSLVLIGIDLRDAPSEVSDARAASWMKGFDRGAAAPLHAVAARPASSGRDLLFVAQHPPEPVRALLQAWGIDRDRAERQAYARLRERSLDALARSLSS